MLSLFPQLFVYQEMAPFILRLAAGFLSVYLAYPKIKNPSERLDFITGLAQFCAGFLLVAGFLTQLAAGLIIISTLFGIFRPGLYKDYKLTFLLIAILIALMFLGPGFFSIDLPL